VYRGSEEGFAGFDFVCSGDASDGGASASGIADKAEHDFRAGFVGDDVGGAAAGDRADVERGRAKYRIGRQREGTDFLERIE